PNRADPSQRVVEQGPLERRRRQDPKRVALAHAEREQAVRELVDRAASLGPADLDPSLAPLGQVGGLRAAGSHGAAPELSDRSLHMFSLSREVNLAFAAKHPVYSRYIPRT